MSKKYKYTKKHSLFYVITSRDFNVKIFLVILANLLPFVTAGIYTFVNSKTSTSTYALYCAALLCSLFGFSIASIALGSIRLFCLWIRAAWKQRFLPVTEQDLQANNITSVPEYWEYLSGLFVVGKRYYFDFFNETTVDKCEHAYNNYFSKEERDAFLTKMNTKYYYDVFHRFMRKNKKCELYNSGYENKIAATIFTFVPILGIAAFIGSED